MFLHRVFILFSNTYSGVRTILVGDTDFEVKEEINSESYYRKTSRFYKFALSITCFVNSGYF